jgi:hypothetical protein
MLPAHQMQLVALNQLVELATSGIRGPNQPMAHLELEVMLPRRQEVVEEEVDTTVVLAHLGLVAEEDRLLRIHLWQHQSHIPKDSKQVTDLHHSPI